MYYADIDKSVENRRAMALETCRKKYDIGDIAYTTTTRLILLARK